MVIFVSYRYLVGLGFLAPHLPLVFRYATYTLFYEILPHTKWLCILFGVVIDILIVITLGSLAITGLWLFFAPIWDFFEYVLGLKTRIYMDEKGLEITNKKGETEHFYEWTKIKSFERKTGKHKDGKSFDLPSIAVFLRDSENTSEEDYWKNGDFTIYMDDFTILLTNELWQVIQDFSEPYLKQARTIATASKITTTPSTTELTYPVTQPYEVQTPEQSLPPPPPPPPQEQTPIHSDVKYCPSCNKENKIANTFCSFCGARMN